MLLKEVHSISGLKYLPDFLTLPQKERALQVVSSNQWCDRLVRAQQYYGIKYYQTKVEDAVLQPATSLHHYPLSALQFLIDTAIEHSLVRK